MGSYLTKNEQEVIQCIKKDYEIEAQPYLLHRQTQLVCTLHKITSKSVEESSNIKQIIEEYQKTKCESISKLRMHYHLDNTGYCSDEQHFYLVFEGQNNYSIREEVAKRNLYRSAFNEQEVEQIIATLLCGLREYDHRFKRDYQHLSLECLALDQNSKRIYLKDPWLARARDSSEASTHSMTYYPSPEKLSAAYDNKLQDYDEFLSNLYTIGIISLEVNRLEPADNVYIRKREINYGEIKNRLLEFRSERLRKGVECLLDSNPAERKKIYQFWGIENKEIHYLEPILAQKQRDYASPFIKIQSKQETVQQPPKFQYVYHLNQRPLKTVPSQTIMVPPNVIPINSTVPEPLSTRSNPPFKISTLTPYEIPKNQGNNPFALIKIPANQSTTFYQPPTLPNFQIPERPLPNYLADQSKVNPPQIMKEKPPNFNQILAREVKKSSTNDLHAEVKVQPELQPVAPSSTQLKAPIKNSNEFGNDYPFNPLAAYKQSFTYYEPLERKLQAEFIRSQSIQTRTESPTKQRQLKQAIFQQKREVPIISQTQELKSHPKSQSDIANNLLNEIANESESQPIIRDNTDTMIEELVHQEQKEDTPDRRPTKNKFNSTIVEVRDEDSPDHSSKSEQALQEQYVVEEYETGSRYEGFKSNHMRNGRGKFYYQDGGYYEGQWKDNKMDGYGKLYYEGGKLAYEGNWSQDEFNGQGKVYNDNPVPLETPFDYTNFDLLEDYWQYYEGMLCHDTKQGRGKIKLSNGQLFEGDFHNDRIQGFGKFHTIEGNTIQGIWRESKLIKVITNVRN